MPKLKLFLISQKKNIRIDSYEKIVVCAENEKQAKHYNPETGNFDLPEKIKNIVSEKECGAAPISIEEIWVGAKDVSIYKIGTATENQKPGKILGSFYGI